MYDSHTWAALTHSAVDPLDNDDPPFFQEGARLFITSGGTDGKGFNHIFFVQ